ncbi:helix-turn-helix domain-containing protein [Mucilaginibacter segetis]|uniref:AraC family transcriptional regulator n=1 Tax=Mucilaginibacter segetis TaxID=2793071 RepID=A0A934ULD6_9SPHI|nr:AraC family transcriptional regulator [Mucilaginibacter segetis]MBK0378443.1 AraC family transcriptional regulator [Mucilaginibacter segetis]
MLKNYFKYLNVTPVEERWGIYVTTIGYSKIEPNDNYPNQEHPTSHQLTWNRGRILNDYYIIFISKGKGMFDSAITKPIEVTAGTCFFLYPGVLHRYKPDPKVGWEEYWIGFNGFYIEQLMNKGFFDRKNPFVYLGLNKDILVLFRNLIEAVQTSLTGYPQQIAGVTLQILGLINNVSQHHEYNDDPVGKLISKAKFIIQESFEDNLDMEKLAMELPMGYSSFRKAFKRITGESPNQYHLNLRLERAKNLLATTVLNINEIAYQTGFDSVFYFSKLFKKKNGISPKIYRKNDNANY